MLRQPRDAKHVGIVVVLMLYLVLGSIYSVVTPIFEASDELWHYPFVKHLADGNPLPVQQTDQLGPWRQEGSQPPLYYLLGAVLTFWVDTSDMEQVRRINPHADIGIPTADRNVNMVVHTLAEAWPYRGTVLAVHLVRWMSVLMGAITVLMGYLTARELFPGEHTIAVGAACLTAFNPMYLFVTSSVNNDALVVMLCAIGLYLTVRYIASRPGPREWLTLGIVLGLASISKVSALGMLPLAGVAVAYVAWRRRSWKELFTGGLAVVLPVFAVGGWWYYRNWRLYRDPLGLSRFVDIVGRRHPVPTLRQLLGEWKGFAMSFWGFFGGVNVPAPDWVYVLLSAFAVLGLLGVMIYLWQTWRRKRGDLDHWAQMALVILWPCVVLISLVRWTLMTIASQGRLMFSALTAISLLMVIGLSTLSLGRRRALLPGLMAAVMLVAAFALPFATIRPAYARPPILSREDVAHISPQLNATFGDSVRLLGYRVDVEEVRPGDSIGLVLYWESLAPMETDYSVFVHLLAANDLIIGQRDMYPGQGNYPTSLWSPGDIIADTYVIPVSSTALTPSEAIFEVGLYELETGLRLPVTGPFGESLGDNLRFGRVRLPTRVVDGIPNPVYFDLADRIALIGCELDRTAAVPGQAFRLTLYWRALRDVDTNYSVFTQVLGAQNRIWAQQDNWPQGGNAPTATWRKGQMVKDPYELVVAADAPPGVYDLQVGMYDAQGNRLSLLGEGGHVRDDRILLGKVRILPSQ